jgi:hypothetical protein
MTSWLSAVYLRTLQITGDPLGENRYSIHQCSPPG